LAAAPAEPRAFPAYVPYVVPFFLWLTLLGLHPYLPGGPAWLYPVRVLAVGSLLVFWRRHYDELGWRLSWLGLVVGVIAIAFWIAIDPHVPGLSRLWGGQAPAAFDPTTLPKGSARLAFLVMRVVGAVLVVPVMEELFWRGFLARWLVKDDFKSVPVGSFTPFAFAATVILFGLEHEQWVAGLVCGALYNLLLLRTRDLAACVVAHAVSNGLLAAWVLTQKAWHLW
jgi:CAAX protease family protein